MVHELCFIDPRGENCITKAAFTQEDTPLINKKKCIKDRKSKNKKHKKCQMSIKKSFIILLGQNIFNTDIVQYTHYLCIKYT